MVKINLDKGSCNLCGTCIDICPMAVFEMSDNDLKVISEDKCIVCHACEIQCDKSAINIDD